MPFGKQAVEYSLLHRGRQLQQAHGVVDGKAAFAHALPDLFLRQSKLFGQLLVSGSLFQWIEVLALQILDERKLENVEYMRAKHADLFATYRPDLSASHARFALLALGNGKRQEARKWAARSIRANPKRFRNWLIGVLVLAMPPMSLDSVQAVHHRIFWRRVRA